MSNDEADSWYLQGNEKAKQIRDRLSEKMSFEDVAAAQALSSKCAASGYKNCEN